jgi:hypothetical protein
MESMDGRGLEEVRRLLTSAQGYAVLGRDRKRVGIFIELADPGRDVEHIAIRRDGVFVWRRELLPLASVERVLPEQRAVLVDVEGDGLQGEQVPVPEPAREDSDWRGRIARYVAASEGEPDRHLRFISTPSGYRLVEAEGPPPSSGTTVAVSEQFGPFLVMRLGPSPLPNDDRICAYLAPD